MLSVRTIKTKLPYCLYIQVFHW